MLRNHPVNDKLHTIATSMPFHFTPKVSKRLFIITVDIAKGEFVDNAKCVGLRFF